MDKTIHVKREEGVVGGLLAPAPGQEPGVPVHHNAPHQVPCRCRGCIGWGAGLEVRGADADQTAALQAAGGAPIQRPGVWPLEPDHRGNACARQP